MTRTTSHSDSHSASLSYAAGPTDIPLLEQPIGSNFEQTVAVAEYRKERRTMRGYLPRSTYYADAADFDAHAKVRCR